MFCENCGAKIGESAKFCRGCGKPAEPSPDSKLDTQLCNSEIRACEESTVEIPVIGKSKRNQPDMVKPASGRTIHIPQKVLRRLFYFLCVFWLVGVFVIALQTREDTGVSYFFLSVTTAGFIVLLLAGILERSAYILLRSVLGIFMVAFLFLYWSNKLYPQAEFGSAASSNTNSPDSAQAPVDATPQKEIVDKRLGVTYAQAASNLNYYFPPLKRKVFNDGTVGYTSWSKNKLAMVEIDGDKRNISKASIMIFIGPDDPKDTIITGGCMLILLHNVIPSWKGGVDWVTESFKESAASSQVTFKRSTTYKNKFIEFDGTKSIGEYFLTIKHKL